MFGWFKRLVARPERRVVFWYHNGLSTVCADPLVIVRNLEDVGGPNWTEVVEAAGQKTLKFDVQPKGAESLTRKRRDGALLAVADMARRAFGLIPLREDGKGLTEAEQVNVLTAYLSFVGGMAEAARPFPSSPPPASQFRPRIAEHLSA